jgi:1,6-anhydro-N-acetylmuramate kinase
MDEAMRKLGLGLFDNDGLLARSGNINDEILELFINELENLSYPRADDTSVYMNIFEKYENEILSTEPADALCTLTELTATKIIEFLKSCNSVDELIFHGGGTENKYLMSRIKELAAIPVKSIDDVAPSKYIEAIAFAYLAFQERAILFK